MATPAMRWTYSKFAGHLADGEGHFHELLGREAHRREVELLALQEDALVAKPFRSITRGAPSSGPWARTCANLQ